MNAGVSFKAGVCVLLAISGIVAAQRKLGTRLVEQTHFSAEDESVERPVAIPGDVMAILAKQEVVSQQLENERLKPESLPSSWFSASVAHLGQAKGPDLVVVANPPISGANTTTFWIFRTSTRDHQLVLTAMAHDLTIKKTRWMGLRDIQTVTVTMMEATTVSYKFDGKRYALFSTAEEGNR